jgi:uncharacterized protein
MKTVRTIIMAKAPIAGLAKTRLIPALGEASTALLAKRMLIRTINTAMEADLGPVECCVTPDHDSPVWSLFKKAYPITWSSQMEGDLGQRMSHIAARASEQGEKVILIGTDCPSLKASHLRSAAEWIEYGDACMIPVTDGGYCLLALRQFHPAIFQNISWSTDSVAEQTRQNCMRLGWQLAELNALYDIDSSEDLAYLSAEFLEGIDWQTGEMRR